MQSVQANGSACQWVLQRRGSAVFEVASTDAPGPGGVQDVPNFGSTGYDCDNVMISDNEDEVDVDDDKDYDFEADTGSDDADGPAHQAFQGEHPYIVMECMTQPGNCRFSSSHCSWSCRQEGSQEATGQFKQARPAHCHVHGQSLARQVRCILLSGQLHSVSACICAAGQRKAMLHDNKS